MFIRLSDFELIQTIINLENFALNFLNYLNIIHYLDQREQLNKFYLLKYTITNVLGEHQLFIYKYSFALIDQVYVIPILQL